MSAGGGAGNDRVQSTNPFKYVKVSRTSNASSTSSSSSSLSPEASKPYDPFEELTKVLGETPLFNPLTKEYFVPAVQAYFKKHLIRIQSEPDEEMSDASHDMVPRGYFPSWPTWQVSPNALSTLPPLPACVLPPIREPTSNASSPSSQVVRFAEPSDAYLLKNGVIYSECMTGSPKQWRSIQATVCYGCQLSVAQMRTLFSDNGLVYMNYLVDNNVTGQFPPDYYFTVMGDFYVRQLRPLSQNCIEYKSMISGHRHVYYKHQKDDMSQLLFIHCYSILMFADRLMNFAVPVMRHEGKLFYLARNPRPFRMPPPESNPPLEVLALAIVMFGKYGTFEMVQFMKLYEQSPTFPPAMIIDMQGNLGKRIMGEDVDAEFQYGFYDITPLLAGVQVVQPIFYPGDVVHAPVDDKDGVEFRAVYKRDYDEEGLTALFEINRKALYFVQFAKNVTMLYESDTLPLPQMDTRMQHTFIHLLNSRAMIC